MGRIPMLGTELQLIELCSYWVMGNRCTSNRLSWLTCCPMLKQRGLYPGGQLTHGSL